MTSTSKTGASQPLIANRKVALLSSKQPLAAHSAMPRMKKAAVELRDQATPLGKALYAEKRLIEALDKYILAKSDATKAWSNCMQQETNSAIKALYQNISELDDIWVMLHQRYKVQLPEQRRLFKQLSSGEHELAKLQKLAASAATRSTRLGKQLDDSMLKMRTKALDMKKIETLEAELSKAVKEDKLAQRQYVLALDNYNKFKHKEVKKVMSNLAEMESQLYQDFWKMAEVKSQICKLYMDHAYNKDLDSNTHRAANESRQILNDLYNALGVAVIAEADQNRPVQPAIIQHHVEYPDGNTVLPSAPPEHELKQTADVSEDEACYRSLPEIDSDNEEYGADYIYEFDDKDFSDDNYDEDELYENVEESQERNYLQLIAESSIIVNPEPEREVTQQEATEDIFGSIASLNLRPRNSLESLSGTPASNSDDYGRLWEYSTRDTNNSNSSSNNNNGISAPPMPTRRGVRQTYTEDARYVKYPGSQGERGAVSTESMMSDLEEVLRQRFQEFKEMKLKKRQAPLPPVPPRAK